MGIFDGCLLACDIDGTLVSGELFPERNIRAIEHFTAEGGAFSLSTGRSASALGMVTSKINNISLSVLTNGCVIYDFKEHKAIWQACLSQHTIGMAQRVLENYNIGFEMHSADRAFVPARCKASDLHEEYEHISAEFVSLEEARKHDINKVLYFIEDDEHIKLLENLSKEYENDCTFFKTCAFINGRKQNYFEQLPKGASKSQALDDVCKMLNIKRENYFAIGDYYNDVPMLTSAYISAVPEGAPDDIKNKADITVCPVSDGAVADFIEYLEDKLKNGQANKIKP